MTASSSSSGDSSLPKKHRPSLDDLSQETTERDLWDLSDESDEAAGPAADTEEPPPAADAPPLPAPRKAEIPKSKSKPAGNEAADSDLIRVNVNRPKPKVRRGIQAQGPGTTEDVFDDLDKWDESEASATPEGHLETPEPPAAATPAAAENEPAPAPSVPEAPETPAAPAAEDADEFTPRAPAGATPVSLQPRLSLSKIERIGLVALAVVLIAAGGLAYWFSISRIPSGDDRLTARDFPVRGAVATVTAAETYWRAPVAGGPEAEKVRRGTLLIPVIELKTENKPAVLRVVFHDDTGAAVGDTTTREIRSETMTVAATAGFDELGMHAAYRTGSIEPWTVKVLEGRPGATRGEDFAPLFEIEISALRR